jgi:hypothetical protein
VLDRAIDYKLNTEALLYYRGQTGACRCTTFWSDRTLLFGAVELDNSAALGPLAAKDFLRH